MVKFPNLAASSAASGFQYYKTKEFSYVVPGQFLPLFSGSISHYTNIHSEARLAPVAASNIVLAATLVNVSADMSAGTYKNANSGIYSGAIITGSSGGFPIFYGYSLTSSTDGDSIDITFDVSNGSAVNNVTPPNITISGKLFFYLAPF
jgi:hypothetical protein